MSAESVTGLVEFLRARLDEDERIARLALTAPARGQDAPVADGELDYDESWRP